MTNANITTEKLEQMNNEAKRLIQKAVRIQSETRMNANMGRQWSHRDSEISKKADKINEQGEKLHREMFSKLADSELIKEYSITGTNCDFTWFNEIIKMTTGNNGKTVTIHIEAGDPAEYKTSKMEIDTENKLIKLI